MQDPYGKLWTEFFPSFYGPSAKRASNINKEGKKEDTERTEHTRLIRCLLMAYGFVDYSSFEKDDGEQEIRVATYGPELANYSTRNQSSIIKAHTVILNIISHK